MIPELLHVPGRTRTACPLMTNPPAQERRLLDSPRVPALLLLVGVGFWAADFARPQGLLAAGTMVLDADRDGLSDRQERILRTNPDAVDTDGDQISDAEEVARQTDPRDPDSLPGFEPINVGMAACQGEGVLTVTSTIFLRSGNPHGLDVRFGAVLQGRLIPLPTGAILRASRIGILNASEGLLFVVQTPFPGGYVRAMGGLNLYATARDVIGGAVAADALNLVDFSGVTMSIEPVPGGQTGGVIYVPLTSGPDLPVSFNAGLVCWQGTSEVGSNGASSVQEVESAGCEPMDSSCSASDCASSVGTTIQILDPGVLIGG